MGIVEVHNHNEVLTVLNYVNTQFGTHHTKHEFGNKIKFVLIETDGNVVYLKTFKTATKYHKPIHTFTEFVNGILLENSNLNQHIQNMQKELETLRFELKQREVAHHDNASLFKTIFKL